MNKGFRNPKTTIVSTFFERPGFSVSISPYALGDNAFKKLKMRRLQEVIVVIEQSEVPVVLFT